MNSTTRKIFAGVLGVAMVIAPVAGVVVSSAFAASYTFSTNLTVGSTGADVTALQSILNAGGFLQVQPTGYFGSLTQAALAAWQSSVGISPAVGYFGSISRAYLNNQTTTGTTGGGSTACPTGYTCMPSNPVTTTCPVGFTCSPVGGTTSGLPAGCVAGAAFSSTTGQACTSTVVSNQQGILTLTLAGSPASQGNIQTSSKVPVWGLQASAQLGDVTISKLDLDVGDVVNASPSRTENPGNFINNISVWDGSTLLLSRDVSTADFIQNPNNVSDFYISLQGLNFSVPQDVQKTLVVSFSVNGGIDTSRTLTIQGYAGESNNLSAVSQGVYQYYNVNGSGFTRTQTFQRPGNATVSFGIDASNPISATNYDDPNAGVSGLPVFAFNGVATNGSATIKTVTLNVNSTTGIQPSTVYLYDGSNLLNSVSVPSASSSATLIFNNLNDTIASGATNVYTVKLDYSGTGASTQTLASASTTLASVQYQQSNGSITTATPNIVGNDQFFVNATPNLTFVSGSATVSGTNSSGSTTNMTGTFVLRVTPQGGSMVQPKASDFNLAYSSSTVGAAINTGVTNQIVISPQPAGTNPLSTGGQYTLTVTGTVFSGVTTPSATYTWYLTSASTSVLDVNGINHSVIRTWGLSNFYTNSVTFVK